jgi:beta-hydroxylase
MPTLVAALMIFAATVTYVYISRGIVRHENFNEYLRNVRPFFAPLNCKLYMTTLKRGSNAVLGPGGYSELERLRQNWQVIRAEGLELVRENYFDATRHPATVGNYGVVFPTFLKYGLVGFYLKCFIKWSANSLAMVLWLALTVVVGQLLSRLF